MNNKNKIILKNGISFILKKKQIFSIKIFHKFLNY